jgi:hypothetical protein
LLLKNRLRVAKNSAHKKLLISMTTKLSFCGHDRGGYVHTYKKGSPPGNRAMGTHYKCCDDNAQGNKTANRSRLLDLFIKLRQTRSLIVRERQVITLPDLRSHLELSVIVVYNGLFFGWVRVGLRFGLGFTITVKSRAEYDEKARSRPASTVCYSDEHA